MKRLRTIINSVVDANINLKTTLNVESTLVCFAKQTTTYDGIEEADVTGAEDEAGNSVVAVLNLLDKSVKCKIEQYIDEVRAKVLELASLRKSKDTVTGQLKNEREYVFLIKDQIRDGQADH